MRVQDALQHCLSSAVHAATLRVLLFAGIPTCIWHLLVAGLGGQVTGQYTLRSGGSSGVLSNGTRYIPPRPTAR
jgi:hypothetical protein